MPRPRVIIVDDDHDVLEMLVTWFEEQKVLVSTAPDAMQAVIQARSIRPTLIVSDLMMPEWGTGADVLKQLRADPQTKDIPFVFLTGLSPAEASKMLPPDSGAKILHKPIQWPAMVKAIKELVGIELKDPGLA